VPAKVWWGNLCERGNLDDLGVEGRVILKEMLNKSDGGEDRIECIKIGTNGELL
jgi:hypothetical protein